ncbi:hypothetical protein SASPL_127963 [Salvia splendens]|uniref:Uncharacterized protein n=1 Tax=Salvia splendens TaxID=180675 RepID=A0A8X8XE68_SALSN|nr:hypothetical protein SASPL_127963 [Salvia splendens]
MDPNPNPNPDLSSQGSLGSMSAGGVSTDTPKTVLETPRDPIDDFHSSGSEPTDNNSSRVSVDTIPAVGGALADAVGVHFVKTVKAHSMHVEEMTQESADPGSGADSASKSEALERTLKRKERDTDN